MSLGEVLIFRVLREGIVIFRLLISGCAIVVPAMLAANHSLAESLPILSSVRFGPINGMRDPHPPFQHIDYGWADNKNPCDENDRLVKKYRTSYGSVSGLASDGRYYSGSGIVVANCSAILTSAHVLYSSNKDPLQKFIFGVSGRDFVQLSTEGIRQGDYAKTRLTRNDLALIPLPKSNQVCVSAPVAPFVDQTTITTWSELSNVSFHMLRQDEKTRRLCAQKCALAPSAGDPKDAGAFQGNCHSYKGASGSPLFVRIGNDDQIIGVTHGLDGAAIWYTLYAPADLGKLQNLVAKP